MEGSSDVDVQGIRRFSARHATALLEGTDVSDRFDDLPYLVLETTGRRSGEPRLAPLVYGRDGASLVVVGSLGGAPSHPRWFLNLEAEPDAHVHLDGERFAVRARVAQGDERSRLWTTMVAMYPPYEQYQEKTDREIPIVILEPVA